jgi:hypothetical protein
LHFLFSFEPRFSEVDKSLFVAPPLRTTSCNVRYSGPIIYDNERETWSKSNSSLAQASTSQKGTFPCLSSKCKTCDSVDSTTIVSAPKSVFHIKHLFTCASSHLIYCISCSRCGMLYIGETGRCLRTRFGEHQRAVIGNDANKPVARHFNNGKVQNFR